MVFVHRSNILLERTLVLSDRTEGEIVKLLEDNVPVEFYIAKHDYEPDLNGIGRTLLVRKAGPSSGSFGQKTTFPSYINDTMDKWCADTYKLKLSANIQEKIGNTSIYVTKSTTTVTTIQRPVFTLSLTELGLTSSSANIEGSTLPIASMLLQVQNQNGIVDDQWTRTVSSGSGTNAAWTVDTAGQPKLLALTNASLYRPCVTLPYDTQVAEDGLIV